MPTTQPPTPAQLAGARRELARRPPAIPADLQAGRLPGPVERAARRVEDLWPAVAAAVPRLVLLAGAQAPPPGRCRWCLARLYARVGRVPLRLTPAARSLLGVPCVACRLALVPPRPPATRRATARSSTPTGRRALVAAAHAAPGITPAIAAYNRQACRRLGLDPARWPHLTRATTTATRGRR
jgi:hypothetical protein